MNNMTNKALSCTLALLICGCATTVPPPLKYAESTPVPDERLLPQFAQLQNSKGAAHVIIVRDLLHTARRTVAGKEFLRNLELAAVFLDGRALAHLAEGESISFYLPPGHHLIGLQPEEDVHSEPTADLAEQELNARDGASYFYRINFDQWQGVVLRPSSLLQ